KDIIFPTNLNMLTPKDGDLLVQRYNDLWQGFIDEFIKIPNKNPSAFIDTLLILIEKYTWCIPSSTMDLPDISLFDHSKTTAAIAACLYDYHNFDNTLEEKYIKNRGDSKYLLVCGDISGIQKFIYNITAKGAAKGLKGRSFFLQLLMDATSKYILRRLEYPLANLLYASGGKFYLLVSNGHEETLEKIRNDINLELLKKYNGELFLALGWCHLGGLDFLKAKFPPKWREASQDANKQKQVKFSRLGYREIFSPFGFGEKEETCSVCKKEGYLIPRREDDPEVMLCPDCEKAEMLGSQLSRATYLIEVFGDKEKNDNYGFHIPFLSTKYYLIENLADFNRIISQERDAAIYRLNSTNFLDESFNPGPHTYGFKFVGGTHLPQKEDGMPLTFNEFAEKSKGLKRLGILRMDVDNLGRIFTKGFGNRASISRVTTLSRSLSQFFGGYLNTICCQHKYKDCISIIYSGGDDLFVVGAWNHIIDLAEEINTEFKQFASNNPAFTLSGGVAMTAKKYPVYRGAKHAGDAESKAKDLKRKDGKEKDAFTFLSKALSWDDFTIARGIKELLYHCIADGKPPDKGTDNVRLSKGILDRLKRIYLLYEINRKYWQGKKGLTKALIKERLQYHKWVWRSVYSLDKAAKENSPFKEDLQLLRTALLENCFRDKKAEGEIIEFIDIPTRWVEFLLREE
ncbi:MAG: type III-A CRISPR-associated protein Cas10/Csm1, partial [Deltaproteobacteria bacterium]|nr:type III-A CRISPR-associated protein Cas10/Csm1 [Deltaproteobacteria bacterium]